MDLRESTAPPPPQTQQQLQPPPGMLMGPTPPQLPQPNPYSSSVPTSTTSNGNNTTSAMIMPNSAAMQNPRFPFSSAPAPSKPLDAFNYGDGSSSPGGFSIDASKKKRGRPRKYSPDGGIALGLTPATPVSAAAFGDSGGGAHSSEPSAKRRGRPAGSGKKQLDALGAPGVGFTPHVINVKAGEDIASKIMAFSQQGPRTVCILSANGAIGNVTLRQPAMSGGTVTYEGRFEIISLTGSFLLSESNGNRSRTGGLSVSLAGSDGRVLGGGVAGMLIAATPVQVIVGSFIEDGKKPKSGPSSAPVSNMFNFGAVPVGVASPPSQGASSESSDEEGSPINRFPGPYNNAQPIQNVQMYSNLAWAPQ